MKRFVLKVSVDQGRKQFLRAVHVNGTIVILEFVEWTRGVVVAVVELRQWRANDQW